MVKIRRFKLTDTKSAAFLISQVFATFNNKEGSIAAVKKYTDLFNINKNNLDNIKEAFLKTPAFFIAVDGFKVIGLVRGGAGEVINLFVHGSYHKKGIGEKLIERFEKECKKDNIGEIKVRSSLFAVSFYERLGYKKTTGVRLFKGLKVQPMRKIFVD